MPRTLNQADLPAGQRILRGLLLIILAKLAYFFIEKRKNDL